MNAEFNSPAAAGFHVNHQNENVIINVQMDEHPARAPLQPDVSLENGIQAQQSLYKLQAASEMDLLSSQTEIICLIKAFSPLLSLSANQHYCA